VFSSILNFAYLMLPQLVAYPYIPPDLAFLHRMMSRSALGVGSNAYLGLKAISAWMEVALALSLITASITRHRLSSI
jgi:hypothetical protein